MTASTVQTIDCRGQQCPGPILATARAARRLARDGGTLEVLADDDAFPLDLRSWCKSSGSELLSLTAEGSQHRAILRIGGAASSPAPVMDTGARRVRVDCLGLSCPQPILAVARAARREPEAELEIVADDDAFELDIESWCRSAGAELASLEREGDVIRARVRPGRERAPAEAATPPPAPGSALAPVGGAPGRTLRLDIGSLDEARRLRELDRSAADPEISTLVVIAPDRSFNARLAAWCADGEHTLVSLHGSGPVLIEIELAGRSAPSTALAPLGSHLPVQVTPESATLLVLHNEKEALLAALLVANGAAAQGMDVTVFFTFWGLNLLRGDVPNPVHAPVRVSWAQRLFKWLMPRGPRRQSLGKLNFGGMGSGMLNQLMREKNIMDLPELLEAAQEQRVRFIACTMSMDVMGITKRDLHPYRTLEFGGVAAFVESARNASLSLVF